MRVLAGMLLAMAMLWTLKPGRAIAAENRFFTTSDGVHLHYLEAGNASQPTLVFVPGWTMPAWIWDQQIGFFAKSYHVIAFDPRGQGESEIARSGYEPVRRGRDIGELIAGLGSRPVLVVAWSLGVLDTLAYVKEAGDQRIAGLVLVDNSVGEEPAPRPPPPPIPGVAKPPHAIFMRQFVHAMFHSHPPEIWLDRLTQTCLRTPEPAAKALLAYPVPRSFWKEAVYSTSKPVLYIVRPKFAGQAGNLAAHHPSAESVVLRDAGHALFVDDAPGFDRRLRDYIARRVWPSVPPSPARANPG